MCAKKTSQIRITSGKFSGLFVDTPKNTTTKPMGERERLAIFNQIHSFIPGSKVLDAFAGSGVLALTALSNDASFADFFEKDPIAIKTIRSNLAKLKLYKNDNQGKIARKIDELSLEYDLIFADPPYDDPQLDLVAKITKKLNKNGTFVLSIPKKLATPSYNNLEIISERDYAGAKIVIYRKSP